MSDDASLDREELEGRLDMALRRAEEAEAALAAFRTRPWDDPDPLAVARALHHDRQGRPSDETARVANAACLLSIATDLRRLADAAVTMHADLGVSTFDVKVHHAPVQTETVEPGYPGGILPCSELEVPRPIELKVPFGVVGSSRVVVALHSPDGYAVHVSDVGWDDHGLARLTVHLTPLR